MKAPSVRVSLTWLGANPLFVVGLAARIVFVAFVIPETHTKWFTPFMEMVVALPSIDPWTNFLFQGGSADSFPYGPIMLLSLLPGAIAGAAVSWLSALPAAASIAVGLGGSVLVVDCLLFFVLCRMTTERRLVTVFYWLSPITFYTLYWHGQLDVIPVLFMMVSLHYLERRKFVASGAVLGLAVAAKLSILLALPFVVIYLLRNTRLRRFLLDWSLAFAATAIVVQGPFLLSPGVRSMVLATPQTQKALDLAIDVAGLQVYLLPVAFLLAIYLAWRVRKMSFALLLSLLGVGFFLVLLLTPAAPGWFLWFLPFLVLSQISGGATGAVLGSLFSAAFVVFNLLVAEGAKIWPFDLDLSAPLGWLLPGVGRSWESLALTALSALGIILVVRLFREGIQRNDYYRLSRSPLIVGIAGDSGAGKDTLAQGLKDLFGASSLAHLSGDDYHLWNRGQPMWQVTSHLNPMANDLARFTADALKLADGKAISVRHYDHSHGRYGHPSAVAPRDVVIISGLHALYPALLRERLDVKVFLDPDESLRRLFKVRRDTSERGHSPERVAQAIEARMADSGRFIRPQATHADVIFALKRTAAGQDSDEHLLLAVTIKHCLYLDELVRCLIGICALHVDYSLKDDGVTVELFVEGDVRAADIAQCARHCLQHLDELLDVTPAFSDGMLGIMQFVVLAHSAQALRSRLV